MSQQVLVVSDADVASLSMAEVIAAVRDAYIALSSGDGQLSPKHRWQFSVGTNSAFAGYITTTDAMAIKLGTFRDDNVDRDLPIAMSQIIVHDAQTGAPLAIMNANRITALRTGAAAAIGAMAMARSASRTAAIFGTGVVAVSSLAALALTLPLERVLVVGTSASRAEAFVEQVSSEYGFEMRAARSESAVGEADVIVTATTATSPLFPDAWVTDGTHISTVGSCAPGRQELDPNTIRRGRFVTDSRLQALEIGEANVPHSLGAFSLADITAEIGEVLAGKLPGRTSEQEVTVFDSSGVAVQDAAVAHAIVEAARHNGVGQWVDF